MREPPIVASSREAAEHIYGRLRAHNRAFLCGAGDYRFHIEENGTIVAGIVAGGVCDTLEIEFLFVDEAHRGKGLGKRLIAHAEEAARRGGLTRVLLNTYSFQAPEFYKKLGYTVAAKIDPCFGDFAQYFFTKRL